MQKIEESNWFKRFLNLFKKAVAWLIREDTMELYWDEKHVATVYRVPRFREFPNGHLDVKSFLISELHKQQTLYSLTLISLSVNSDILSSIDYQLLTVSEQINYYLSIIEKLNKPSNNDLRLTGHLLRGESLYVYDTNWYCRL